MRSRRTRIDAAFAACSTLLKAVIAGLACTILLTARPGWCASILVVASDNTGAYAEFTESLRQEVLRANREIRVTAVSLPMPQWRKALDGSPAAIVAVGVNATEALVRENAAAPLLAALIPKSAFDAIARRSGRDDTRKFSAIYLDQPFARQLDLIKLALPSRKRIGVVLGPESRDQLPLLEAAAFARQLEVRAASVAAIDALNESLEATLEQSDALLAIPDPLVFNGNTIQNVLLTTYRHQDPLIGFSLAYVRAGAIAAVHSTPTQLGRQAGAMVLALLKSGSSSLTPPQHPRQFEIAVNYRVARSLGIELPAEDELREKLERAEAAR